MSNKLNYQHDWDAWVDPRYPISGPSFNWAYIQYGVIHWPGHDNVPDGDVGESTDIPAFLRQMHRNYLNKLRPYSLGYGGGTDYLGGTWKIRGDTFRNAANKPADFNLRSISQTILTDLDGKVTQLAIDGTNELIAQWQFYAPEIIIIGHGQGNRYYPTVGTYCPGPIVDLIDRGIIGVRPPTIDLEVDMIPAVAKTTDGPFLAQFGHHTAILTMGSTAQHDVSVEEVFGRGDTRAYCVNTKRVVSWTPDNPGSWDAVKANLTTAQAKSRMS